MILPAHASPLPLAGLVAMVPFGAIGQGAAPSGQPLALHEVLSEEIPWSSERQIVVRVVAPMIAEGRLGDDVILGDMEWACRLWGHSAAGDAGTAEWVVVEMMAEVAPRGTPTPEIARFFETFRREGDDCIWELF